MRMKTLTYSFLLLTLAGLLVGHGGGALLALLWAGVCWYGDKTLGVLATPIDAECDLVYAVSLVMEAMTSDAE